jgi:nicotinate-nucleotide adenylyltransferase
MTATRRLGVLGGTFDPVHYGHLDAAEAARARLELDTVLFVPAHDPPHKPADPRASAFHRFALVALALQDWPGYSASDMELQREGASYTADTLRALHAAGYDPSHLFFILGADAFAEIGTWKEYPAVTTMAQFVVVARPGTTLDAALARVPQLRDHVTLVEARTRDVSSSQIRARLAARQPIDDLVPPAVARHIITHSLYGAVDDLHDEGRRSDEISEAQ